MNPEEIAGLKQEMNAAMDLALSDANPFSRVAERMKQGMSCSDALAQEIYPPDQRIEARTWLQGGTAAKQRRFIHTYSRRGTTRLVEELYAAGAKAVWVVRPQGNDLIQTSDVLLVALPRSREHKLALARIHEREMAKVWGCEPAAGILPAGRKHLVFQYT